MMRSLGEAGVRGCALDEATAQHMRLPGGRVIEYASLTGGHAFFAVDELDVVLVARRV